MQREITDAYLRTVKSPSTGRLEIWDSHTHGLVLRITPTGAASWAVRTRTATGKRTRVKLGSWPAMGIRAARGEARKALGVIEAGGDPVGEKRAAAASLEARASLPTVGDRMAAWQAVRASQWSARYASEVQRIVNREILPAIGKRPLVETTREIWTGLIAAKAARAAATGAMLYRTASAFLNFAEARGWVPIAMLPRKGASMIAPPTAARARVLTDAELKAVWLATERLTPKSRAFMRLLILCACREAEAADVSVGEVNLAAGRWSIPGERTKNRLPIVLPLPDILVADLREVWPTHDVGPGWRLLGQIRGSGLRGFSKLKRSLDEKSGVSDWRFHDLRRTARTGLTRLGVSRDHAEASLNHVSGRSALERVYDRHDYHDEVIAALQRWQVFVVGLVTSLPSADIVPIGRRSA